MDSPWDVWEKSFTEIVFLVHRAPLCGTNPEMTLLYSDESGR